MKAKTIVSILLCLLLLAGCTDDPVSGSVPSGETLLPGGNGVAQNLVKDPADLFTERDLAGDYDKTEAVMIRFEQDGASCDSRGVAISGTDVTILGAGTYVLEGSCGNGTVTVDAPKDDKIQLVLNGITLGSHTDAVIHVLQASKVFITLAEGSENHLSNDGSFESAQDDNVDGVIFSKADLTLNGTGSLTLASPGGHGIVSKDALTVTGGTYHITAASHGITGKDDICIAGGAFTLISGKDGVHAENTEDITLGFAYIRTGTFHLEAQGDGISASGFLQIDGGTYTVITGGGSENGEDHASGGWGDMPGGGGHRPGGRPGGRSTTETAEESASAKGLKAATALVINDGSFTFDCADDAVHANGNVAITGGNFAVETGDDGFHADETLAVSGGTIVISESYEGLEGQHIAVSGGSISITSSDDGINAAGGTDESGFGGGRGDMFGGFGGGSASKGSITVSGGEILVFAGGDGIDSNGSLTITGGKVTVHGPTVGDTAVLDYDTTATISGGTFIGTGAMNMAQTFSASENQGLISVSIGGNVAAGTKLTLADETGNVIMEVTPNQSYAIVILSSPAIRKGQTYTITVGEASARIKAE